MDLWADALLIAAAAFLIDRYIGDVPNRYHPLRWMGLLLDAIDRRIARRGSKACIAYGLLSYLLVLAVFGGAALLICAFLRLGLAGVCPADLGPIHTDLGEVLWILFTALILKVAFALFAFRRFCSPVQDDLREGRLDAAAEKTQMMVNRKTAGMDSEHICSSCCETISENLVDSVLSPLLYFGILGLPGAVMFRCSNLMDAMWGRRNERYNYLGRFPARLDDVLGYVPSRLSPLFVGFAAWLMRMEGRGGAVRAAIREHRKTPSPNSGWPMTAAAAAMGVSFEKEGVYVMGEGPLPSIDDIARCYHLIELTSLVFLLIVAMPLAMLLGLHVQVWLEDLVGGLVGLIRMKYVARTEIREEENEMATAVVRLAERMEVLSNAPLNGGRCLTDTVFIMQVPHDYESADYVGDLEAKRAQYGLPHDSVGFMTAAEVKYVFSGVEEPCGEDSVFVAATAGVTNCVVAGEPLDDWEARKARSREIYERLVSGGEPSDARPAGTINVVAVSPVPLTNGAKVNLMIPLVEAKAVAMSERGYVETGTTSDAMAIVSPVGDSRVRFAGTGTGIGMAVARAVRKAVGECLANRGERPAPKSAADMLVEAGATPEMFWTCAESLGLGEEVMEEFGDTLEEMCDDPDVCSLVYGVLAIGRGSDRRIIKNQEDEVPGVLVDGTMAMLIASRISEERGNDSAVDLAGMDPLRGGPLPEYAEQAVYGLTAGVVAYMTGYSDERGGRFPGAGGDPGASEDDELAEGRRGRAVGQGPSGGRGGPPR